MPTYFRMRMLLFALPVCVLAQPAAVDARASADITAGNRAWIDGMKKGDAKLISAAFAEDAVDCSPAGECIKGRAVIERQLQDRIAKLGRAVSASVTSKGSVRQGNFVYEWGEAEASLARGNHIAGRYLTVWRQQPAGGWEIFRNIRIPNGSKP